MPRINKITVRRGKGAPPDNALDTAELAFDMNAKKLYVGDSEGKAVKVGGDSIWMGTQPPEDKDIKYWIDTSSDGSVDTEKAFIVDTVYPVGSIYMSITATNPQLLFGGTWERIKDTFLLSAGDNYIAGSIGGQAEVTLDSTQMPSHTHTFTGTSHGHSFTGTSHDHSFTGTEVSTGNQSASHSHSYPNPLLMWNTTASTANVALSAAGKNQAGWRGTDQTSKTSTGNQSANHSHKVTAKGTVGSKTAGGTVGSATASGTNSETGGGAAHNNMPPYLTVYMWKRVS